VNTHIVSLIVGLGVTLGPLHAAADKPVKLPDWLLLDAEYRVESIFIDPVDLNGTEVTDMRWTEQRMRLDFGLKAKDYGGIYIQADLLNGVLFGDNGDFGGDPSSISGLALASKNPNMTGWKVGLKPGADPLDYDSYLPVLKSISPIELTKVWAEARLPVGILRVGRMGMVDGALISGHDGERRNRWGVSRAPDLADRVLFATKIDAIIDAIKSGGKSKGVSPSVKNGIILAGTYDWNVQDSLLTTADDAFQVNVLLSWRKEHADWLGAEWRDFVVQAVAVHKGSRIFDTNVWAFPVKFESHIGPAYINMQFSVITGETREISDGLAKLAGKTGTVQTLLAMGAHAFLQYELGPVRMAFEFNYATGDADPRSETDVTTFSFARDFNVGLLMFERILGFQSARAAAVGIENLRSLDAASFPLTELATQGRFHNAIAIFPQVDIDIVKTPKHHLHSRIGVLAAWPEDGVVDPIQTVLNQDGSLIADDAVNWHGGKPGSYYGTEVDLQLEWTLNGFFTWTLEGAVLFPGDGLQDEHGDAQTSFLVQNRFMFVF